MFTPAQQLHFHTPQQHSAYTPSHLFTPAHHAAAPSPLPSFGAALAGGAGGGVATPFSLGACSFGGGMFSERANSLHFPTAASELVQGGFARSAALLLECSLTFYTQGMDAVRGSKPEYKMYKPQPQDVTAIPPPAAMALFGQCCLQQGEYKRAIQYLKTSLGELAKLKRSPAYASNPAVLAMNILNSPEREWTLSLVDALLAARDDAQAQKILENMYNMSLAVPTAQPLPVQYQLQLARFYAAPAVPTSAAVQQSYTVQNTRAAIAIHTRLIQQQPLALESALELIKLQTDPRPIVAASFATHFPSSARSSDLQQQCLFLHLFLTANWHAAQGRFIEAITVDDGGLNFLIGIAPRSTFLLETKAQVQLSCADAELAIRTLERMHSIDPYAMGSMDLLALLYTRRGGAGRELATLMAHCLRIDECRPESWCVAACSSVATGAKEKATKYMEKALVLLANASNNRATRDLSPFAQSVPHTIRGLHLLEWEKAAAAEKKAAGVVGALASPYLDQSMASFRKAVLVAPLNSVATVGLAQAYLLHAQLATHAVPLQIAQHASYKTALQLVSAPAAQPLHAKNPRILANCGLILAQSAEGRQKAAKMLHRAIQLDHEYSDAVLALADMYCASQQYPDALLMLVGYTRKVASFLADGGAAATASFMLGSRDYFLIKIGQIHALKGDIAEAMQYYKQALANNPNCTTATEAMNKLEQDAKAALDAQMCEAEE